MLRSITRNAFAERTVATRRRAPLLVQGRYGSAILRGQPGPSFKYSRLLSTPAQHTKIEPSASKAGPLIPPDALPRKAKVDLKPAPVKPSATTPTPMLGSKPPPRHIRVDQPKSSPPPTAPPVLAEMSVAEGLKEAKLDIDKAQEHGVLAPPPPGAGWAKRMFHHARELFKFYWNGLKMINAHRLQVAQIKLRVKEGGAPISRFEYRFMRTYSEDALKLIPFLLVVIIMEELIPLIAIYAPFMLPSTTIFPSQLKRMQEKALAKQLKFAANKDAFRLIIDAAQEHKSTQRNLVDLMRLRSVGSASTQSICGVLRLPAWGPAPLLLWRIDQHLRHIAKDDHLLLMEDMGARLNDGELESTLAERGIITSDLKPEQSRKQLKAWLTSVSFGADESYAVSRRIFAVAKANASA